MMLREQRIGDRRLREPFKSFYRITSVKAVIHDYIRYRLYGLYNDVLIAVVSCHGLRPPNHFGTYLMIRQQDWRRPVSLVVCRIVILVRDSWVNHFVSILRNNINCTEELNWIFGNPQRFVMFIRIRGLSWGRDERKFGREGRIVGR